MMEAAPAMTDSPSAAKPHQGITRVSLASLPIEISRVHGTNVDRLVTHVERKRSVVSQLPIAVNNASAPGLRLAISPPFQRPRSVGNQLGS